MTHSDQGRSLAAPSEARPVARFWVRVQGLYVQASLLEWILLIVILAAAAGVHASLLPNVNSDFTLFYLPWFEFLRQNGFAGLGQEFANYNVPYLYLLYIGTLTPLGALETVKLISSVFDVVLAAGAFGIFLTLGKRLFISALAAVLVLLLPEVFLNSAMWGQAESLYGSLIVWSLFFVLRRSDIAAWVFFALALMFKLQTLFALPALILAFILLRHRYRALIFALGAALLTYVPSIVAGRSVSSLARIYTSQAGEYPDLALYTPTIYQWVSTTVSDVVSRAGVFFALAVVAIFSLVLLRKFRHVELRRTFILEAAAAYALVVPFVLPHMHDRYFYVGDVLVAICAVLQRRYIAPAIMLQVTAVMAYGPILFGNPPPFPYAVLTGFQLIAICWVVAGVLSASEVGKFVRRALSAWATDDEKVRAHNVQEQK